MAINNLKQKRDEYRYALIKEIRKYIGYEVSFYYENSYYVIKVKNYDTLIIQNVTKSEMRITSMAVPQFEFMEKIIETAEKSVICERCPICNEEVNLKPTFEVQICPNCGNPILPCSICKEKDCRKCPLKDAQLKAFQEKAENDYWGDIDE